MVVGNEYKDRFAKAMADAGKDAHAVAKVLDVSYQAIMKVLMGTTKMLKADHNSVAAIALGVDTDWLATGAGEPARRRLDDAAALPFSLEAIEVAQTFDALPVDTEQAINIKTRVFHLLLHSISLAASIQSSVPESQPVEPPNPAPSRLR